MLKWIETTGRNEDGAIQAALTKLGLDRDDVSVELVERAKPGFLGIGGNPAKVRVTYEAPDEPTPVPRPAPVVAAVKPPVHPVSPAPMREAPRERGTEKSVPIHKTTVAHTSPPAEDDDRVQKIVGFLTGLLERMEVAATPSITVSDEGNYKVELVGGELGALIGRRGETLDAIQQLTSYAVNRGQTKRVRVHVDAENYRTKREESLQRLAIKVADKVIKYRRNVTLEPMNAYERHVIHTALQEYPDVTTYSTGTEPNRRTVVGYARGEHKVN